MRSTPAFTAGRSRPSSPANTAGMPARRKPKNSQKEPPPRPRHPLKTYALADESFQRGDRPVGVDPSVALDRQRLAGELVDDMQQLHDPASAVWSNWKSSAYTWSGAWARSRSAATVEVPNRWRLRRRCGTRRPSSRHNRCVRLRFSSRPRSSSSWCARRYPHRGRSR